MAAAMIGTGILFFPVAPMFLFMRGKDTVIARGAPISTDIDGNTELVRENCIGAEPSAEKPAPPPAEKNQELHAEQPPATPRKDVGPDF